MKESSLKLKDDFEFLNSLIEDEKKQSELYLPGPYWEHKVKASTKQIKKYGIQKFRSSKNSIGDSYADNMPADSRNAFHSGLTLLSILLTKLYPLSRLYEEQVNLTKRYAIESLTYSQEILALKGRTKELISKYKLPYTLLGNCNRKVKFKGEEHSVHYLDLLDRLDKISDLIDFKKTNSILEIGGGFGGSLHLILENFKNIRKVIYLDIPPNLYVATQYLKAFYGDCVKDYVSTKDLSSLKFSLNRELEIFCIAPWQIEQLDDSIDILMSQHCLLELPKKVVKNYVEVFENFPNKNDTAVALTSYGYIKLDRTFHPNEMPSFFGKRKFENFQKDPLLPHPSRNKEMFYIYSGDFSNN